MRFCALRVGVSLRSSFVVALKSGGAAALVLRRGGELDRVNGNVMARYDYEEEPVESISFQFEVGKETVRVFSLLNLNA